MQAQQLFHPSLETPPVGPFRSAQQTARLNRMRFKALACRTSARVDVGEACRMLHIDDHQAVDPFEELILKALHQGLARKPRFHAVGAEEETFDESWLLQAMEVAAKGDGASLNFLLRSRVQGPLVRSLPFLIKGAVGKFGSSI